MATGISFNVTATDGAARTGVISTPRGQIRTPAFMPVGTAGTVKAMLPDSVAATGADILLGNTYHLMLHQRPEFLDGVRRCLQRRGLRIPQEIGLALLDLNPDTAYYSGIRQTPRLMGATAAELLIGRVLLRDFGRPAHPKV